MSSYNNNNFSRSMFGINSVLADNVDTTNLVCDTITINTSGIAPTMPLDDDSNNLATTAFVKGNSDTLQSSYDNSINPEIILNNIQGAINIKGDSSTLNIFELQDESGNLTCSIGKNGDIGCNNVNANRLYTDFETPINTNELTSKNYVDNAVLNILDTNNTWTGSNDFTLLPTSSQVPINAAELVNKLYVDDVINDILDSNNTWTGSNDFTLLPTSSQVPINAAELTNKAYVDDVINDILDSNNTWTGSNDFTLNPTCGVVPTANNELTNKLYVDDVINDILDSNNVWTGTNDFTNAAGINVGANSSNYINLKGTGTTLSLGYLCGNNKATLYFNWSLFR
jgi:hypothetical protein